MPPQETKHIPVSIYVPLVLIVAILACVSVVFSGAGTSVLQWLCNITPEPTSVPALETQIALQETVIAQQKELLDGAKTPASPISSDVTLSSPTTNSESVNPSPSETPIILPTSIEASEPSLMPTSDPICDTRSYVREPAATNTTKTYIRCPVGEVEYSIQVDDFLDSIILECPGNEPQEIKYTKNESRSEGQLLLTFDSDRFTSYAGCKVKITITSSVENIGYTIRQEIISP